MKLKVLASGSHANGYILENETEALVIEAGVPFRDLVKTVDYKKIVGCIISHMHKDHARYEEEYRRFGITVCGPGAIKPNRVYKSGGFEFTGFENHHDVICYGYKIYHNDVGTVVFATDTGYIEYKFYNVNHWMIECNYSKDLLDKQVNKGFSPVLADRITRDHMSLETCKAFFERSDLSKTQNIILLHLSDGNSNEVLFQREIQQLTKRKTYIAGKGLAIDLSLCPF